MVIDFHTHTFPDKIAAGAIRSLSEKAHIEPCTDATSAQLRRSMDEAGIDLSIVLPVATAMRQVVHINDSALKENETASRTGILSFGCMHPDFEDYKEELVRIKERGMKGIKIHPPYQGVRLDDIRYLRILDQAASLGLIVVTHAGEDIGLPGVFNCTPRMSRRVIDEIGPFPFVLAHMGGWQNWEEVPELLSGTGVYLDTSFCLAGIRPMDGYWDNQTLSMENEEQFLSMVRAFGADHILFGTDCPWAGQAENVRFMKNLPLKQDEKDLILSGNARRLLRKH